MGGGAFRIERWIYFIELKRLIQVVKCLEYKARLVAQKFGSDLDETFSPVKRLETVKLLSPLCLIKWYVHPSNVCLQYIPECSSRLLKKLT